MNKKEMLHVSHPSHEKHQKYVGVGTILIKNEKEILLVFRGKTTTNSNVYGLIGGLVEQGETALQAAIRELHEEVGIIVHPEDMHLIHVMSSRENTTETIGLYFCAKKWQGEPYNKETHKHDHIKWFDLDTLPENMILRNRRAIDFMKKQILYSEYWVTE